MHSAQPPAHDPATSESARLQHTSQPYMDVCVCLMEQHRSEHEGSTATITASCWVGRLPGRTHASSTALMQALFELSFDWACKKMCWPRGVDGTPPPSAPPPRHRRQRTGSSTQAASLKSGHSLSVCGLPDVDATSLSVSCSTAGQLTCSRWGDRWRRQLTAWHLLVATTGASIHMVQTAQVG